MTCAGPALLLPAAIVRYRVVGVPVDGVGNTVTAENAGIVVDGTQARARAEQLNWARRPILPCTAF